MPVRELKSFTEAEKQQAERMNAWMRSNRDKAASLGTVSNLINGVVQEVADHVADLRQAVRELEGKIELLEYNNGQPQLRYMGVYRAGESISEGTLATHKGTLWIAKRVTNSAPGTDDSWQMMVKSPQAARGSKA
jgi:predicted nuclease with TOPRIM domain